MVGKMLSVIPSVIKRGEAVKELHASQGIDSGVFVFNKLTLPENSEAVKAFQTAVARAYDELFAALPDKLVELVGEDQLSTAFSLAKDNATNNPLPADIQSFAHRQNLTDAGTVTVWEVAKEGKVTTKANLAAGISL